MNESSFGIHMHYDKTLYCDNDDAYICQFCCILCLWLRRSWLTFGLGYCNSSHHVKALCSITILQVQNVLVPDSRNSLSTRGKQQKNIVKEQLNTWSWISSMCLYNNTVNKNYHITYSTRGHCELKGRIALSEIQNHNGPRYVNLTRHWLRGLSHEPQSSNLKAPNLGNHNIDRTHWNGKVGRDWLTVAYHTKCLHVHAPENM